LELHRYLPDGVGVGVGVGVGTGVGVGVGVGTGVGVGDGSISGITPEQRGASPRTFFANLLSNLCRSGLSCISLVHLPKEASWVLSLSF